MRPARVRIFVASLSLVAVAVAGLFATGCSADAAVEDESSSSALESLPGGITDESIDAEGARILANDRNVTWQTLATSATLPRQAAEAIVAHRSDASGAPRWFTSLTEVLALPEVGESDVRALVLYGVANGYAEKRGFEVPNMARLSMERAQPRPSERDITVEAGFDGKAPDEVVDLVRARLTNVVHQQNESFVRKTIRDNHKAFTIAAWNMLGARGSPPADFANNLQADKLTMMGTMSSMMPVYVVAERGGQTSYYARGERGTYQELPSAPKYPVIMRARLRLAPAGIRVFYPEWSAPVLARETTTITEGP